jgi:hypothetical protein
MPLSRADISQILGSVYPFRKLDPAVIEKVFKLSKLVNFAAGEMIYLEGDPADTLFFLLEGTVDLSIAGAGQQVQIATLSTGDIFGYESLSGGAVRKTTASAQIGVSVLAFSQEQMVELVNSAPALLDALELLQDSFDLSLKVDLDWMGNNENVYYIARRHTAFLFLRLLPPLGATVIAVPLLLFFAYSTGFTLLTPWILLGVVLVVILAWAGWEVLDWSNDYSIITNQRVLFQERVVMLYDSRQEAPMNAVQSVTTESTQVGRMLHFGNVIVKTFAGMIKLPDLKYPEQVAKIVESGWFRSGVSRTRAEQAAIEKSLRDRLGYSINAGGKPAGSGGGPQGSVPVQVNSSDFQKWLTNMFQMRFEQGGGITYRKHWWNLILNIWLPTLLVIGLIALIVLRVMKVFELFSIGAVVGLALILMIIVIAWWIYQYADWRNDYYVVTDEQVLDVYKKPLGREEKKAAPIKNIQSIEFERRGLIGLLLNYGTVYVKVGETSLSFEDVFNPAEIQRELFKRMAERDYKEKQRAVSGEQQRLTEWIQIYDRVARDQRNPTNPQQGPPK